jgi:hypothetical protein
MSAIDVGHLQKKPYFDEALHVIERMGLTQLLSIQCDYDKELILQFYSSLVMMNDDNHTLKWISGANQCTATVCDFADALGFEFDGPNALGARFFNPRGPNKDSLYELYSSTGEVGTITGRLPLYDQLQGLFKDTITPSGGNNDAIRTSLIDLLYHAHLCASSTDEFADFRIDIMDFIFNEIHAAWLGRVTLPYAPYIMLLINHVVQDPDLSGDVDHKVKKPYVKRKGGWSCCPHCSRCLPSHFYEGCLLQCILSLSFCRY